jgi:hypothetical protein
VIRIRWRVVFAPVCWALGHDPRRVESVPMGWREGLGCRRCSGFLPWSEVKDLTLPRAWMKGAR